MDDPNDEDDGMIQVISDMELNLNQMRACMTEDSLSKSECSIILNGSTNQALISLTKIRSWYDQIVANAEGPKVGSDDVKSASDDGSKIQTQQSFTSAPQSAHHDTELLEENPAAVMSGLSLQYDQETEVHREALSRKEAKRNPIWQPEISEKDIQRRDLEQKLPNEPEASRHGENSLKRRAEAAGNLPQHNSDLIKEKDMIIEQLKQKLAIAEEVQNARSRPRTLPFESQVEEQLVEERSMHLLGAAKPLRQAALESATDGSRLSNCGEESSINSDTIDRIPNSNTTPGQQHSQSSVEKMSLHDIMQQLIKNQAIHEKELDRKNEELQAAQAENEGIRTTHTRLQAQADDIREMNGKLKHQFDQRVGQCLNAQRESVILLAERLGEIADFAAKLAEANDALTDRLDGLVREFDRKLYKQSQDFLAARSATAKEHSKAVSEAVAGIRAIYSRRQKEIQDFPLDDLLQSVRQSPAKRRPEALDDSPLSDRRHLPNGKRQKMIVDSEERQFQDVEGPSLASSRLIGSEPIMIDDHGDDQDDEQSNETNKPYVRATHLATLQGSSPSSRSVGGDSSTVRQLQADVVVRSSHTQNVVSTERGQDESVTQDAAIVGDTIDAAGLINQDQGDETQSVPPLLPPSPPSPPSPPHFVPPTSTDPSDLADAVFSLFYPMWDVTDRDEEEIKTTWRSAFRAGKSFEKAVEEIDRHVLGTNWTKAPEYPRGCLMADVTSKNHGPGGYAMSQDSCPYCGRKSKTKRFCQWALLVPGLQLGFKDRVNGRLAPGERDYIDQMNNLTTVLGGRRVRYLLFKRREPGDGNYAIPVKTVDGVRLPPVGAS